MKKCLIFFILTLLVSSVQGLCYSGNPPNGKTGAPGEGSCIDCHSSFPLNSGDGALTISAPETFQAGMTYPITVTLSDDGMTRWGFEITPLTIGGCQITDASHTQVSIAGEKSYVKQTSAGTYNGDGGPVSWSFDWIAPQDPPSEIIFYASGNAANGNFGTSGDYIYTASFTSALETGIENYFNNNFPNRVALDNFPNPFNPSTEIYFYLPEDSHIKLDVYDIKGNLVAHLLDEFKTDGAYAFKWAAKDDFNKELSSGIYFCRLHSKEFSILHKLILLK